MNYKFGSHYIYLSAWSPHKRAAAVLALGHFVSLRGLLVSLWGFYMTNAKKKNRLSDGKPEQRTLSLESISICIKGVANKSSVNPTKVVRSSL